MLLITGVTLYFPFLELSSSIRKEMEWHPDDWYRRKNPQQYADSLTVAADFIGADRKNMILMENTTAGERRVI